MVVLDPLKVVITNFPEKGTTPVCVPNFPDDPSKGSYTAQFDRTIFIERSDFKEVGALFCIFITNLEGP